MRHHLATNHHLLYIVALSFVEIESSPVRCLVSDVKNTACGADFTVWLSSLEGASILYGLWILFYFLFSIFKFLVPLGHEDKLLSPSRVKKPLDYLVTGSSRWGSVAHRSLINSEDCCTVFFAMCN